MRRQFSARDRCGGVLRAHVLTKTEAQAIRRVPAATLRAFLFDALRACGLNDADAATVASAMLEADLTGSDAHGVFRLAGYVRALKRGAMNPRASIRVLERGPATALIDGDRGMGHVVMTHAANLAVELARASGIGWVGARRSNHAGAGAIYAAIPLQHGMVGIYGAASSVNHMAPWGGSEPLLGTNPIAVARHLARIERRDQKLRARRQADAAGLGAESRGWLAHHGSSPHQRGHLPPHGRLQGQRALDRHRTVGGTAQRRRLRPRHPGFCRAARRRAQCRAIRDRARRRALRAA
ncbi:MAG: Ldh family oxidoreductase [Alphaproteobacteria bacterium]|nr:MAG: Ldh family oxidoreductase [Alphaproteobacteria bacterium]